MESERKNAILKKLFYNVSRAGLHVPVQVVYDPPYTLIADLLQKPTGDGDGVNVADGWTRTSPAVLANWTRGDRDRNSRRGNWTETPPQPAKANPKQYYLGNVEELASELVSVERELLKSINRTKNPFAFFVSRPEFSQRLNNTGKRVPIIFHFFSPPSPNKDERNDTKIDHSKYIIPILDKLKELNDRGPSPANPEPHVAQSTPTAPPTLTLPYKAAVSPPVHYPNVPLMPYYSNGPESLYVPPYPYTPYAAPYYPSPYEMFGYGQWPLAPIAYPNYAVRAREPYSATATHADAIGNGHICQRTAAEYQRMRKTIDRLRPADEESNGTYERPTTKSEFEFGQRRYDDDEQANVNTDDGFSAIEYVANGREKRMAATRRRNFRRPAELNVSRRRETAAETNKEDAENVMRAGSDVGPQISKLIVRRGGVAIAGAGGIATAGSGGTAIVGPGGTAFTTPASSGGVAMVGPGGKVVNLPEVTNVLYGRTANVAATGAGHSTFTNERGEVFTTSDDTGGVALVNPGGQVFGLSDSQVLQPNVKGETKEIQLPAGARLLTTGPIIYYNPVYPMSKL